ncbi:hypothetical protein K440DRAFT_166279 [Wilcoxina mikolae CBS 423.85]|nr:hypothetical protein K440DRAFT_166279 [Wilcoxina mikolae CBS 423.85]
MFGGVMCSLYITKLCKGIPGRFALPDPVPCSIIYSSRPKVAATCVGSGAAVKRTPKSCQIRTQIHAIRSCGRSRFRLRWKIFAAGAYFPILSGDFCRTDTVLRHEPGLDRTLGTYLILRIYWRDVISGSIWMGGPGLDEGNPNPLVQRPSKLPNIITK